MTEYAAIDGDVSDFLDSMIELTNEFNTEELRHYLLNVGHSGPDVSAAIAFWQKGHFEQVNASWDAFRLTTAGMGAVEQLRDRLD